MSTTAQNMQELLPPAEPTTPAPVQPPLAAPPGVTLTNASAPNSPTELAPPSTKSVVDPMETTRGQITDLLSANSPYLQQARDRATRYSASRGLQNSSIAAQAGEQAGIAAALPIASDTAATYNQRALANQSIEAQFGLAKQGGEIQTGLIKTQGEVSSKLQAENATQRLLEQAKAGDIAAQQQLAAFGFNTQLSAQDNIQRLQQLAAAGDQDAKARLEQFQYQTQLTSQQQAGQAQLQQREIANQQWMASFSADAQAKLQGVDIASREAMQKAGFTQEQALQAVDVAARQQAQQVEVQNQQWLAQFDAGTRTKLQGLDADVRQSMQQLDLASQQRIADMNVATSERSDAARMATAMETTYATMLETIANNPDIPADTRQTYIDNANQMRDSNLALIEQLFGVDLQW